MRGELRGEFKLPDRKETIPASPGTVIAGTHRPEDLIPAFIDTLFNHLSTKEMDEVVKNLSDETLRLLLDQEGEGLDWESENVSYDLEMLFDKMDEIAPEDHYFGANPGDGSDFGFWPVHELPI